MCWGGDFLVRLENRREQGFTALGLYGDEVGAEGEALVAGAVTDEATALVNGAAAGGVAGEGERGLKFGGDPGARVRNHGRKAGAGLGDAGDQVGAIGGRIEDGADFDKFCDDGRGGESSRAVRERLAVTADNRNLRRAAREGGARVEADSRG